MQSRNHAVKAEGAPGVVRLALDMRALWALGAAIAAYPFAQHLFGPY